MLLAACMKIHRVTYHANAVYLSHMQRNGMNKMTMTINEIIKRELTVDDFTDAEIVRLAYAIKNVCLPGHYWNSIAYPQFLARINAIQSGSRSPATRANQEPKSCRACGNSGNFTTLAGGDICDDCI